MELARLVKMRKPPPRPVGVPHEYLVSYIRGFISRWRVGVCLGSKTANVHVQSRRNEVERSYQSTAGGLNGVLFLSGACLIYLCSPVPLRGCRALVFTPLGHLFTVS